MKLNQEEKIKSILKATTVFQRIGRKWQEGRASKEEVRAKWGRLLKDLEEARLKGDHCLLEAPGG